jgi:hypothetical protein
MKPSALSLCLLLLFCACVSPVQVTKPGGDTALVTFGEGGTAWVELLAISDSGLVFIREGRVWKSALADASRIAVEGYSLRTGKRMATGCIGVVIAAACVDVIMHSAGYFAPVFASFYAVGTYLLFKDEPRVDFRAPFDADARQQLPLYCRYPQGLSDAQWHELLQFYHQDTFLSPGDLPRP